MPMSGRLRFNGDVADEVVETLRMPLSELVFQHRRDGSWRCAKQVQIDDEDGGLFDPGAGDWISADQPVRDGARSEWAPGARDGSSWWLVHGDASNLPVTVTLSDGRTPPIATFGPLWVCEWVSQWQTALVTDTRGSRSVFDHVPGYLRRRPGSG